MKSLPPSRASLAVVIPAFNADTDLLHQVIKGIIENCREFTPEIVVVDDGSTVPVRLPGPESSVLKIIRHPRNLGKGAALKTGFRYFLEKGQNSFVITLDADLQHPPHYLPEFISAYHAGKGQLIIGARRRTVGIMPPHRIISNTLTSLIISGLVGQLIRDSQCGFRLIDSRLLESIRLKEVKFHLESELLLQAGWQQARIAFVPIPTVYGPEKSSINPVRDTVNFVFLVIHLVLKRILGRCTT